MLKRPQALSSLALPSFALFFLTLFFFSFTFAALTAQDPCDEDFGIDYDFAIDFDDFPDNSLPDLESIFENENEDDARDEDDVDLGAEALKELEGFISKPDTSETIDQQSELGIDFHGFPSTIVNGCVNVVSGDYQETATDFTMPGAMPLNMQRSYCGRKARKHSFLYGWQLSHGAKLFCYKSKNRHDCAVLKGSDRHGALYRARYHDRHLICPDTFFKKGVTNCSLGEISAKTNLKNDNLYKLSGKRYLLETADRTFYVFSRSYHDPQQKNKHTHGYRLDLLNLPDGNSYRYKYSDFFGMPTSIDSHNREGVKTCGLMLKKIPSRFGFQDKPELTYLTPTDEKITYRFELYGNHYKKRAILSEVFPPHSPSIKYTYESTEGHFKRKRLIKREMPNNRVLELVYNENGKIQKLISPAGNDGELVATHTFDYFKDVFTRSADVRTALGGLKKYRWNKRTSRLQSINTYDKSGHKVSRESYRWGNLTENASHLTARIIEDGKSGLLAYQEYQYDKYGNIACSALYGNITGNSTEKVSINKYLSPPEKGECEVFKTYWEYDSHKRRVLESDRRISNRFIYLEETDLLAAQLTSYDDRIQLRHFYWYDASGAVCKEISDDGSSRSSENLRDVTERQIKHIQNNLTGLPEVVEDFAYDLSSGQNRLIKKTFNQYDCHNWMIAQSIYDSENNLSYTLEWEYDSHGNVILEKDALGNRSVSKYDENDNLIYEQKPDLAARILSYDLMNRLVLEEQKAFGEDSLYKQFQYDAMGNCISTIDIYGKKTQSVYNSLGRLVKTVYPGMDKADPKSTISYKHDALGRAKLITDANGSSVAMTYNLHGKPICTTYPDGTSEKNTYTIWGDLSEAIARDKTSIQYAYDAQAREISRKWFDAKGALVRATSKTYNGLHLISETDGNGNETHYTYDFAGRLASEKTVDKTTLYAYDTLGRQTAATQLLSDGSTLSFVEIHDVLDRVVESYKISPDGEISNRVLKSYDAQGKEIQHHEWNQAGRATTSTEYDAFGRVTCVTNPLGLSVHTVYHIDDIPRQEITDPLGIRTVSSFDPFGRPVTEQRYDPMGQLVEQIDFGYDANGNKILRRVKTADEPVDTVWEYDALNQLTKTTEAAGTTAQKSVRRKYDAAGRLITLIKNDGVILSYTYDSLGRRTSQKSSDGTLHYTYSYDGNDNMLSAEDKINGTAVNREYDAYDQLLSDTLPYGHTLAYAYNDLGNLSQVTLPDQTKIDYVWQGDRLHSVSRDGNQKYSHTYTSYDDSSNPTSIQLAGNAGSLQVDYDLLSRPLDIRTSQWQEALEYDAHLLKQRRSQDGLGKAVSNYSYDARDQLLSEDGAATHQFEYDWQGNPTSYDGSIRQFNACNALLEDGQNKYVYDSNGNRISDGINNYSYDVLDRLVEVKTSTDSYRYVYDALNRRVARLSKNETTYYLWQQQQEIGTISNGIIQELQVLNPSNHAIAIELQGTVYVPLHDVFGHVRALIDTEGNCVASYRYSAFGEEQVQGSVMSPWRYAGKRIDQETGFIYFGERYYDPTTLCWINPDPMEDADGPNLYAYVHNNPLFYVDPDGCFSWKRLNLDWTTIVSIAAEAALVATVVGSGLAGVAEGFIGGCTGGISGTAIDLAFDAAALYGEGGVAAACAGAETTTITYNVCKSIGRVAGAIFSCTPAGKAAQVVMSGAKLGINAVKGAATVVDTTKKVVQGSKVLNGANRSRQIANNVEQSSKRLHSFLPRIEEGNKKFGLKHIMSRHSHGSNAKNASKFLPGITRKEIGEFTNHACQNITSWKIDDKNKLLGGVMDMGKIIGNRRGCGTPTSDIMIVLKGNLLYSAYPY